MSQPFGAVTRIAGDKPSGKKKENIMNPTKRQQKCAQFDSKGNHCGNLADLMTPTMPLDFCAKHNHMAKTGMPVKCWRCGDR